MPAERLQKILARAGFGSRRQAEVLIANGEVTVNGKVAKLGDQAEFGEDHIKVSGKLITKVDPPLFLVFNKPKNVVSSMLDPEGRPCLADYLARVKARVYPVGRLDFASEGLILLTNQGAIAEKLQKNDKIPRVYSVKVHKRPSVDELKRLEKGGRAGDQIIKPKRIFLRAELTSKAQIDFVFEGPMTADLKAFVESRGFRVDRVVRTQIGQIQIKDLKPGETRVLKDSQVDALINQPELGINQLEREYTKTETKRADAEKFKDVFVGGEQEKDAAKKARAEKSKAKIIKKPAAAKKTVGKKIGGVW